MRRNSFFIKILSFISAKASLVVFAWCLCSLLPLAAQSSFADSLLQVLPSTAADTHKVHLLNDLAWEYKFEKPEEARQYLQQSINLAKKITFPKGEAQAYNNLGVVEAIAGDLEKATLHYQKALELRQGLGDKAGVASLYNNIGNLMGDMDQHVASISNLKKSLRIREELKDSLRIARVNYNIGVAYEAMGNYPEALDHVLKHLFISEILEEDYEIANAQNMLGNIKSELERFEEALVHHQKALELRLAQGDDYEIADSYNNLANSLDDLGEQKMDSTKLSAAKNLFEEALKNYQQSLKISERLEDEEGLSQAYNNIGLIYKNLGTFYDKVKQKDSSRLSLELAMDWLNRSLVIREKFEDQKGLMEIYNGIGDVRRRQKDWAGALKYTKMYHSLAEDLEDNKYLQKALKDLARAYAGMGRYKEAFDYRKEYDEMRYARLSEERTKQNSRREAIYGDDKKQVELDQQQKELALQSALLERATFQRRALIGGALALFFLVALLYNRFRLKAKANRDLAQKNEIIEKERERSEDLLLNILPAETAEELKSKGKAKARYYESVTVLFTDFKSFTSIAEQMSPEELVAELDECFRAFDEITGRHGIEKIKTIGDAYMCAGGIPVSNNSHAKDVVAAALEIQDFMEAYGQKKQAENRPAFKARIGVHTGPVVAGIVGSKKFAYDIWGDTVNTAARMESSGKVGQVNISQSTYDLINKYYDCSSRGKVEAKGKGEIEMYFVEKRSKKVAEQAAEEN